ncbi:Mitochondrial import inner membrane translocase subunit [Dirofilaria immitis]
MYIVPGESKGELEFAMGRIGWAVLSGYVLGSLRGILPELRNPNTRQLPFKPFVTRLMNSSVKHGSGFAHPAGSIVFMFSVADMIFGKLRAKDDLNALAAGAVTGGLFRCAHGLHASITGTGIGIVAAFIWLLSDQDSRNRLWEMRKHLIGKQDYKNYFVHDQFFVTLFFINGIFYCVFLKSFYVRYDKKQKITITIELLRLYMDDDFIDLLVVSSIASIGLVALTFLVTKTKLGYVCYILKGKLSILLFSQMLLLYNAQGRYCYSRSLMQRTECIFKIRENHRSIHRKSRGCLMLQFHPPQVLLCRGEKLYNFFWNQKKIRMSLRENPHFQEAEEHMLEPVIRLPLVDALRRLSSKQDTQCGFFESQYFHCLEAFGQKLGRKYCDLERRDFNECITNYKQKKRAEWIRLQYKLHWDTKIHGPLPEGAKLGECYPDYFSHNPPDAIH